MRGKNRYEFSLGKDEWKIFVLKVLEEEGSFQKMVNLVRRVQKVAGHPAPDGHQIPKLREAINDLVQQGIVKEIAVNGGRRRGVKIELAGGVKPEVLPDELSVEKKEVPKANPPEEKEPMILSLADIMNLLAKVLIKNANELQSLADLPQELGEIKERVQELLERVKGIEAKIGSLMAQSEGLEETRKLLIESFGEI